MTHLRRFVVPAGIGLLLAGFAAGPASAGKPDPPVPSRLLVTASEYHLKLSQPKIDAGDSIVQLYDFGEDPHNLVLQRDGGGRVFNVGEVQPGETGELRLRLKRGSSYRLWCSIADHAALGMEATLRTSKK